jgi:hypothetical protein
MLKFPDGTVVGVNGLEEIMAELYAEGKKATGATAEEIIERLEAKMNYIPSSYSVRREYACALLEKYRTYIEDRSGMKCGLKSHIDG